MGAVALDPDDRGAVVGEHHPGERRGADAGQLDDADSGKWAGHGQEVERPRRRCQAGGAQALPWAESRADFMQID